MLQQILKEMTIDKELLDELSEDQKQVLFYKMREEQIRRWKLREEKLEEEEKKSSLKSPKEGKKKVNFLKGRDGCDWVWVMGDHKNDKTIEQILEEEAKATALKLAEAEAEVLRLKEEAELIRKIEEDKKRVIREKDAREAEMKRKQEEAEYQSIKEARLALEKMEFEKKKQEEEKKKRFLEIEEDEKRARRRSRELANTVKEKRSSEIYTTLQRKRQDFENQARESEEEVEKNWQKQEIIAKEAEIKMRDSARLARTEYRESLRRSLTLMQVAGAFAGGQLPEDNKPPVPPKRHKKVTIPQGSNNQKPRPAKPQGHEMIISWFQKEEKDRVGVVDTSTGKVVQWFHGIISREESEKILQEQKIGSFLLRVSERVWGYTLSFRGADRCKHFLIDSSESGYQFLGANQTVHESLVCLVKFHKDNPITISGQEKLLHPLGQTVSPPDYAELFNDKK